MIKIVIEQEKYNYGNVGKQPYNLNTTITIDKDGTLEDYLQAFIKALEIDGFSTLITEQHLIEAIKNAYYEEKC